MREKEFKEISGIAFEFKEKHSLVLETVLDAVRIVLKYLGFFALSCFAACCAAVLYIKGGEAARPAAFVAGVIFLCFSALFILCSVFHKAVKAKVLPTRLWVSPEEIVVEREDGITKASGVCTVDVRDFISWHIAEECISVLGIKLPETRTKTLVIESRKAKVTLKDGRGYIAKEKELRFPVVVDVTQTKADISRYIQAFTQTDVVFEASGEEES